MNFHRTCAQGFENSYAILGNEESVDTAVVFVHGFNGRAVGTWENFQLLTRTAESSFPHWRSCDLYFWSYQSFQTRNLMGAQDLKGFIDAIYPSPRPGLLASEFSSLSRLLAVTYMPVDFGLNREYKYLLLVGHSQGSVLIRQAVMDAYNERFSAATTASGGFIPKERLPAILGAQLRLFAPAILGASLSGLVGVLLNLPLISSLLEGILAHSRGYQDLQSTNLGLTQLRQSTEAAARENPHIGALRARVLFGEAEDTVSPGAYNADIVEPYEKGRDHRSICKPNDNYTRPLEFVRYDHSAC